MLKILAMLTIAVLVIQIFALYRNDWVYRQRCRVMDQYGPLLYELLPPYQVMLWKVWIWNVDRFLPHPHETHKYTPPEERDYD
ncbi:MULTISPECIES: hypothetical protein [Serratia]|uniref:hypothetical protein n=1 Tax=Serratia TaxID=613 RepID=UPI00066166B1|nr:hypothetical protein [Serratia sp. 506_PEND]